MKSKTCILASVALGVICPCMLAQETMPGIVHGPKASFNISAPEGWVVDNQAGVKQGMPCVLYPKAESWSDTKTVMYAKVASPQWEGVNAFVAMAIKEMKAKHGTPKEKIASGKTKDGHDYFINEYPATKTYSQWERVGYVQLPQAVAYIVLTSRDQAGYQKDSGALEKVLKTLVYVEPKSETASGQEYARRYRQLLDQHADGQIEPLLTECEIGGDELADIRSTISPETYHLFVRRALEATGDPALGLSMGARAPENMLQIVGHLMMASGTLREAFGNSESDFTRGFLPPRALRPRVHPMFFRRFCWPDQTVVLLTRRFGQYLDLEPYSSAILRPLTAACVFRDCSLRKQSALSERRACRTLMRQAAIKWRRGLAMGDL